eukprot:TRINITY_DN1402_c0_g2_i4.p1 TRINITY_DN1402_c0_g2~~TRINITY_DN1402_c0_g2_i4.p1  ORF type:complete len:122 (-),score=10.16 TRINITY_DN1402_c0_g2_i4:172-537(-)
MRAVLVFLVVAVLFADAFGYRRYGKGHQSSGKLLGRGHSKSKGYGQGRGYGHGTYGMKGKNYGIKGHGMSYGGQHDDDNYGDDDHDDKSYSSLGNGYAMNNGHDDMYGGHSNNYGMKPRKL